jgi:hypothetical protein
MTNLDLFSVSLGGELQGFLQTVAVQHVAVVQTNMFGRKAARSRRSSKWPCPLAVSFVEAVLLAGMAFSLLRMEKKGDKPEKT